MRNRICVLSGLVFFLLNSASFSVQNQDIQKTLPGLEKLQGKFSFIVMGDNRTGDDVYRKLAFLAMERKPAFILNTGDQVATPGRLSEWSEFWEMSKPVTVPYFLTVGNHDINPMWSSSEGIYKEQVDLPGNELFYSFKAGNSLFIVLDSCYDKEEKKITGEQLAWLEKVLAGNEQKHIFVFLHHPLFPDKNKGKHYGNSLDRYPKERDALQALFVKSKVTMVFTGHEHLYLRNAVDGMQHIIAGGAGAPLYADEKDGGFHHFIMVTVNGDAVRAETVDIQGAVRDRF